jgi:hypothetical protein
MATASQRRDINRVSGASQQSVPHEITAKDKRFIYLVVKVYGRAQTNRAVMNWLTDYRWRNDDPDVMLEATSTDACSVAGVKPCGGLCQLFQSFPFSRSYGFSRLCRARYSSVLDIAQNAMDGCPTAQLVMSTLVRFMKNNFFEETMREWIDKVYGTIEVHYAPPMNALELYLYFPQLRHGAFDFIGRIDIFALKCKPALLETSEKVCIIHRLC